MKVSVVIPVYNVEKYLAVCLMSVINQTYKNIEIILIDDGSEDRSGKIADEIAEIDPRMIVVHKTNGGLSSARNVGLEMASGEYITFVDSDDYIAHNYIEKSMKLCDNHNAEISIMNMLYIPEEENEEVLDYGQKIVEVFDSKQAIQESLYQKRYSCCTPGKFYKKTLFKNIRFPIGRLSEDLATCHRILNAANRIVFCNENGYYYRQHNNSIMHMFNPRRMDALDWAMEIEKFCVEKYPEIIGAAKCRTFNVAVHLLFELSEEDPNYDEYFRQVWKKIKKTRIFVILDINVRFRERAAAILSFAGKRMLIRVWNSKIAVKQMKS